MPDSPDLESLFLRPYLDGHIMARLATDLRGRGFDVLRTEEAGNDTASDDEQLQEDTCRARMKQVQVCRRASVERAAVVSSPERFVAEGIV